MLSEEWELFESVSEIRVNQIRVNQGLGVISEKLSNVEQLNFGANFLSWDRRRLNLDSCHSSTLTQRHLQTPFWYPGFSPWGNGVCFIVIIKKNL